ncbi:hypothetical protein TNCV_2595441 [Trichonephila clavipes]|nr:hypothetical protein TNCV_2595441 [Trichonephila clavipes]
MYGRIFAIQISSFNGVSIVGLLKEEENPFDFQRTSLVGLALDSATSSGLGRAPTLQCRTPSRHHLELQDRRDYTPADRAARTCWLGCPRAPVLSGGLRHKTQLFPCTLYMVASSKTPPHQSKVLKSSKPRSKCQFSQVAVRCVIIPKVKKHQTQLHSTQSGLPQDFVAKNKEKKLNTKKKNQ